MLFIAMNLEANLLLEPLWMLRIHAGNESGMFWFFLSQSVPRKEPFGGLARGVACMCSGASWPRLLRS